MTKEIIFDSSFLMAVAERPTAWKTDITDAVGGFEPILLQPVRAELQRLASGGGKRASAARVALEMAGGFKAGESGDGRPDDEIVSAALQAGAAVATTDAALASTLRRLHVQVITLRSGRAVVL